VVFFIRVALARERAVFILLASVTYDTCHAF